MADSGNKPDEVPSRLTPMKYDEVKASAQRVLDERGKPPYTRNGSPFVGNGGGEEMPFLHLTDDELRVLSEFVQLWLPFLVEKEKK